jgi:hypothetical protein
LIGDVYTRLTRVGFTLCLRNCNALLLLNRTTGLPLQLARGGCACGGRGGNTELLCAGLSCCLEYGQTLLLAYRGAFLTGLVPSLLARSGLRNRDALLGWLDLANLPGHFFADFLRD